uniref:Uncharacterized protein n=1 Tax=Arundo donax TaxID=35708 RepID=A0A0A9EB93_ARUDO
MSLSCLRYLAFLKEKALFFPLAKYACS